MIPTPLECFLKWEKESPQTPFFRQPIAGQWHVFTYQQAGVEIRKVAAALKSLNLPDESKVAILSKNCAHWLMADLAIMMNGLVSVPIYPTLSAPGINYILTHSETKVIFVGKLDNYPDQQPGIPTGVRRISFPLYGISDGDLWSDLPPANDFQYKIPESTKLATIMYSSGTTGTPKGVMLTHGAFAYVGEMAKIHFKMKKGENFFSYLPLSHIAERGLMEMTALNSGGTISFVESLDKFAENLSHEQPTIFGGVPRIYSKFQEGILKKFTQKKLDTLLKLPVIGGVIRKVIRKKLGLARAHVIVSGAAPSPENQIEWFRRLGIFIRETYGMTENTAFSHSNYGEIRIGTVGQPWPEVEAKTDDTGEILIKHPALMLGYFKDDETTKKVFTADGFLKTGDQGVIDKDGFLTITGRVKDQFKTEKAKFIAPAPMEMKLLSNPDLEQVCIVGNGLPQPIALAVLSAIGAAKSKEEVSTTIAETVSKLNAELEDYEEIAKLVVLKSPWTLENGLLTPTLKIKRHEIEKLFTGKYLSWYKQKSIVIFE